MRRFSTLTISSISNNVISPMKSNSTKAKMAYAPLLCLCCLLLVFFRIVLAALRTQERMTGSGVPLHRLVMGSDDVNNN